MSDLQDYINHEFNDNSSSARDMTLGALAGGAAGSLLINAHDAKQLHKAKLKENRQIQGEGSLADTVLKVRNKEISFDDLPENFKRGVVMYEAKHFDNPHKVEYMKDIIRHGEEAAKNPPVLEFKQLLPSLPRIEKGNLMRLLAHPTVAKGATVGGMAGMLYSGYRKFQKEKERAAMNKSAEQLFQELVKTASGIYQEEEPQEVPNSPLYGYTPDEGAPPVTSVSEELGGAPAPVDTDIDPGVEALIGGEAGEEPVEQAVPIQEGIPADETAVQGGVPVHETPQREVVAMDTSDVMNDLFKEAAAAILEPPMEKKASSSTRSIDEILNRIKFDK